MADNKDNIDRYVTGLMDEDEEIAFEAEMADDEDLRLHVQLEQTRLANIQRRVAAALESEEVKKTDVTQPPFFLKTLKVRGWQRWAVAAAVVGLAVMAVWLLNQQDDVRQIITETQPIIEPSKTEENLPTPLPERLESPVVHLPPPPDYKKIAHNTYDQERPKAEISTSGEQGNPTIVSTDTATQAFHAYLKGDSLMVFAYYNRHPNERRAVEWKARYLFEQHRYEEAALLFARLKTFPKYEDVGAWNELLCYVAQYRTKKKDFDRLEKEVRKTKYKEDLDHLLKQIR